MSLEAVVELCEKVCVRLQSCGFKKVYQSMKSEARYFQLKGYPGTIRVAWHKLRDNELTINGNKVISKITFSKNAPKYGDNAVDQMVIQAVGKYILNKDLTKPNGRVIS